MAKFEYFEHGVDSAARAENLLASKPKHINKVVKHGGREFTVVEEGYSERYSGLRRFGRILKATLEIGD